MFEWVEYDSYFEGRRWKRDMRGRLAASTFLVSWSTSTRRGVGPSWHHPGRQGVGRSDGKGLRCQAKRASRRVITIHFVKRPFLESSCIPASGAKHLADHGYCCWLESLDRGLLSCGRHTACAQSADVWQYLSQYLNISISRSLWRIVARHLLPLHSSRFLPPPPAAPTPLQCEQ